MSIRASDHAVLQYLERVAGIDIEAVRQAMEAECENHHGAPCIRISGARYLLRDGCIVSVLNGKTVPYWSFLYDLMHGRASMVDQKLSAKVGEGLTDG